MEAGGHTTAVEVRQWPSGFLPRDELNDVALYIFGTEVFRRSVIAALLRGQEPLTIPLKCALPLANLPTE